MKGLSREQRKKILDIWLTEKGISMRSIAKREKVSLTAVYNAIKSMGRSVLSMTHQNLEDQEVRATKNWI